MTAMDPIPDTDLDAYVDGQLDVAGRLRVEKWLARHPEDAARVMADLGLRSTLKLALAGEQPAGRPETREAARHLASGLENAGLWRMMQRIAAVGLLIAAGWGAHASLGPRAVNASVHPPGFVEQAIRAHKTAEMRATMPSQTSARAYDREDIRAATAIVMPELPEDWHVTDVQIFPSDYGPSVETAIRLPDGERISLFAVRPGRFAVEPVTDVNLSNAEAAWWQIGDVAYAVVSGTPSIGLADEAAHLRNSLY